MKTANERAFKPRNLNEAKASFSKIECDTLDLILALVNRDDDDPDKLEYELNVEECAARYKLKYGYNAVRKVKANIVDAKSFRVIELYNEDKSYTKMAMYQKVTISADGKVILIKLGEDFKKMLVSMKNDGMGSITYYDIKYTLAMHSQYSKRLYPMLIQFKKTGARYDSVDELRMKLGVPESYNWNKFQLYVLDKAVEEINVLSNITVSYETKKQAVRGGEKITGLTWHIEPKITLKVVPDPSLEAMAETIKKLVANKYELPDENAMQIAKDANKYGLDKVAVTRRVQLVLLNQNIKNPVGYLRFAMTPEFMESVKEKNSFNNYSQRDYDWDAFEKELLRRSYGEG